jgi:ABC-2 type transport system permease protein
MRMKIILASFKSDIKTFIRSKGTLFWTLAFPIMLILIFGAIFSGANEIEYELYVQDLDNSELSKILISTFEETDVFKIIDVSNDAEVLDYIKENEIKRLLVIPEDYSESIKESYSSETNVSLTFYFDQSEQTTNPIIRNIIGGIINEFNKNLSGGRDIILINDFETITGEFEFIDFFLPGIIGLTVMQTCIYGSLERNTKFRKDGILRKLLTTPITRTEWILSKMLFQLFLSFVSAFLIIVFGVVVYGMTVHINFLMFLIILSTSFLFTGIGMLIGRFVKDEESAGMAGGVVTFPMMFLAGTFFPLEQMPDFLKTFAQILPLYYVNEGLRNAMIYLKIEDALFHTLVVTIFAGIFFISGLVLTKWKED